MNAASSVSRLVEQRTMYREWADMHAVNANSYRDQVIACNTFADEMARHGLAIQAAFNRGMAEHYQRTQDYHRQMETKYRRAACRPWSVIPPDPDPPAMPDPFRIRL